MAGPPRGKPASSMDLSIGGLSVGGSSVKPPARPAAAPAPEPEVEEVDDDADLGGGSGADDHDFGEEVYDEDEDEFTILGDGQQSAEFTKFDLIVGKLEEIIMDPSFTRALNDFCRDNCGEFDESDENKLAYTTLFESYVDLLENIIDTRLANEVPGFSMAEFLEMLAAQQAELDGEVFDLLLTLSDFAAFKELMLSYKQEAAGNGISLSITAEPMHVYTEEQEDGEERLDLNLDILSISPTRPRA